MGISDRFFVFSLALMVGGAHTKRKAMRFKKEKDFSANWSLKNSKCSPDEKIAGTRTRITLGGMFIAEVVWRKAGHGSRKNWTLAQFNPGTGYRVSVEDYPPKGGEAVIARLSGHDYVLHFWKFHIPSVDLPNGGHVPCLYRPLTEEECDRLRFEDDPFLDEEDAKEVFSRLPFVQNDKEGGRALEPYTPRFWEDAIQSSFTIAHRWIAHQVSEPDLFKVSLQQVSLVWARHRATTVSWDTIVEYGACRKGFLAAAYRADILEVFPEEGPTLGQVFLVVNSEEDALYLEKLIKYVEDRYVSST